tara:strand:- start:581 stop:952 length:372 start_codon:yes stop_codon:yes gene_type:complete
MRINEKLEDILVWSLVVVLAVFGYLLVDRLLQNGLFWEIIGILVPVVLVGGVTFTFYQQAIRDYKETGKKTSFLPIFYPVGVVLGWFLLFKVFAINPIFIVYAIGGYLLWALIIGLIGIIKNK